MRGDEKLKDKNGKAHAVRCYDNGGATADRYTVLYMDDPERGFNMYAAVGMSGEPSHPQGIGEHTAAMPGSHLGKRVKLADLPDACRRVVMRDIDGDKK